MGGGDRTMGRWDGFDRAIVLSFDREIAIIGQERPMHITMVKKRLADGSECRKCVEATDCLKSRGLWDRIDDIVWAQEGDSTSLGMKLGGDLGVDRAPFWVVGDEAGETIYTS